MSFMQPPPTATPREKKTIAAVCRALRSESERTDPIDVQACTAAASAAYREVGLSVPEIQYCASPSDALHRLQRLGPEPEPEADGQPRSLLWRMAAALPRVWPQVGAEVDLSFHPEVLHALEPFNWEPGWWDTIEKHACQKTLEVLRLAHTVNDALEQQVTREQDAWLLYTKGASSLWAEAPEYAMLEALIALERIPAPPKEFGVAKRLLSSCGWLYAFERVCLVCDRPMQIDRLNSTPARRGKTIRILWRDGAEYTYTPV
jgi:hypothetical protein